MDGRTRVLKARIHKRSSWLVSCPGPEPLLCELQCNLLCSSESCNEDYKAFCSCRANSFLRPCGIGKCMERTWGKCKGRSDGAHSPRKCVFTIWCDTNFAVGEKRTSWNGLYLLSKNNRDFTQQRILEVIHRACSTPCLQIMLPLTYESLKLHRITLLALGETQCEIQEVSCSEGMVVLRPCLVKTKQ